MNECETGHSNCTFELSFSLGFDLRLEPLAVFHA